MHSMDRSTGDAAESRPSQRPVSVEDFISDQLTQLMKQVTKFLAPFLENYFIHFWCPKSVLGLIRVYLKGRECV